MDGETQCEVKYFALGNKMTARRQRPVLELSGVQIVGKGAKSRAMGRRTASEKRREKWTDRGSPSSQTPRDPFLSLSPVRSFPHYINAWDRLISGLTPPPPPTLGICHLGFRKLQMYTPTPPPPRFMQAEFTLEIKLAAVSEEC